MRYVTSRLEWNRSEQRDRQTNRRPTGLTDRQTEKYRYTYIYIGAYTCIVDTEIGRDREAERGTEADRQT